MHEIETRIIDIDVDDIRKKLINLNAILVKKENQINKIFDFEDKRLLNEKGYARIRIIEDLLNNTNVAYMTTKKMISQEVYRVMDENETKIEDSSEGEKIFKSLGLNLIQSIKKYRESYRYKSTLIEIDINDPSFCPFPYIELEGEDEEEILDIVKLLGYSKDDTTSKTIYELLKDKELLKNKSDLKGL